MRVNNGVRSALEAAIGALSVGAFDPQKRIHAAHDLFNNPNPKALAVVDAQLAKEHDPEAKTALEQARAAIVASTPDASAADAKRAIATLAARGDEAAKNYINAIAVKYKDPRSPAPRNRRSPSSIARYSSGGWRRTVGMGFPPLPCCCSPPSAWPSPSA